MKKLFSFQVFIFMMFIMVSQLNAVEFNVNAETDDSGKPNPSFSFFFDWDESKTYYSGIAFKKIVSSESSSVEGLSESRNVTLYDEYNLNISFINYRYRIESISLVTGFETEFRKIENSEVGFFLLPASMTGQLVAFDNNVKIKAVMPGINAGINVEKGIFKFDLIGKYIPFYYLDVSQKTYLRPVISEPGEKNSDSLKSNAFEINSNILVNFNLLIPWISLYHSVWTTEYDLKTLQYSFASSTFSFVEKTESAKHSESKIIFNIMINSEFLFGNIKPYIGAGYRKVSQSSELADKTEKDSEWIVSFGISNK